MRIVKVKRAISRIQQMERYLNQVLLALDTQPEMINRDAAIREAIQELVQYYDNGQWIQDYELDEQGLLPTELKRGVLAQDTLYDVLEQVRRKVPRDM